MSMIQTDSQHYTDIADAIRTKLNSQDSYYPSDMKPAILSIPQVNAGDIFKHVFNHGDVIGLNPAFNNYNMNGGWSYSDSRISASRWDNGTFTIGGFFYKGSCTKVCVDAEVTAGQNGSYNTSGLYLIYCKNGFPRPTLATGINLIRFTNYSNRTNYDGSSPWYTLQRQICVGSLDNITDEPFYLMFHKCDAAINIYSIYLE